MLNDLVTSYFTCYQHGAKCMVLIYLGILFNEQIDKYLYFNDAIFYARYCLNEGAFHFFCDELFYL